MRSGHNRRFGRLAAAATAAGAAFLTGACASAGGVAGVATVSPTAEPASSPGVIATIPAPAEEAAGGAAEGGTATTGPGSGVNRPPGYEPVRVPPPKISKYTYAFPVKDCEAKYARKLLVLTKTTIWAERGCAFIAPIDGTIDEVSYGDAWSAATNQGKDREGRFVSIIGMDGVRYLGGHLDSVTPGLTPGQKVNAGQTLGRVGNSGNAAGDATNLYFAISWKASPGAWWVRRGMVRPWDYLDAWRDGNRTLSPREEMLAVRKQAGAEPACQILCSGNAPTVSTPQPQERKKKRKPDPTPPVVHPSPPHATIGATRP
ncbi:M23 family metallopeptidase [Spongiactinospora sp. TRM90649]|uniref:M23 family metallopeptidase n=1 Tax=Spongiactinospora sp. TRM90649 TaxID=3031114 RepID=UPI0023F87AE5|nr:M23 family metallopeptidase [Spongiactinospora sp. TRM90649]MDF5757014.1 M23 family metallopeptidase [Spongiactinospora sp. TRM90649]